MLWGGFAFPVGFYALVVALVPLDVLDRNPGLRMAADRLHRWFINGSFSVDIYRHAESTGFPQVAMLASALAVCAVGFTVSVILIHTTVFFKELRAFRLSQAPDTIKTLIAQLVVLPLLGLFCMWAFFCLTGDPSFAGGLTTQGRSGYILLSCSAIAMAGGGIGLWPMQLRFYLTEIFRPEKP